MKRGFTLLELIVVVIILGILATLGLTQYGRMVERSRGAEAKAILGDIRKFAAAHYLEFNALNGTPAYDITRANIGPADDQIPLTCRGSHYFSYGISVSDATTVVITATRCGAAGKGGAAGPAVGNTLILTANVASGSDIWSGNGGY